MNSPEFPKDEFGTVHIEKMRGDISFDHVSFRYDTVDFMHPPREL